MAAQYNILLVTTRQGQLKEFAGTFGENENMAVIQKETVEDALNIVKTKAPVLAIVDDQVNGIFGLDIIRRLIQENAFIQTAAISDLKDHQFHERSEGLGILSKLPLVPDRDDAHKLIGLLEQVASGAI